MVATGGFAEWAACQQPTEEGPNPWSGAQEIKSTSTFSATAFISEIEPSCALM